MGYELNTKAYSLFIQIEVGLREYFIQLIKDYGVQKWSHNFLGSIQRDTLNEVTRRITEATKLNEYPELEDVYIYKLNRAKKDKESSFVNSNLCHPFYYLNWSDLEALMRIKPNVGIIEDSIGKASRSSIVEILKTLAFLRNDIAHSRFISENDYQIIKGGFDQISGLIPNFSTYVDHQSTEENIAELTKIIVGIIHQIEIKKMLPKDELEQIIGNINKCKNSFWLNSISVEIVKLIELFNTELVSYKDFRCRPGGLLQIIKWKEKNSELFLIILNSIENGKF